METWKLKKNMVLLYEILKIIIVINRKEHRQLWKKIYIHHRFVVFEDTSNGEKFLGKSTKTSKETTTFEGQEYPVIKVATSSTSHPFYTGKSKFVDETGRVDKFKKKYNL